MSWKWFGGGGGIFPRIKQLWRFEWHHRQLNQTFTWAKLKIECFKTDFTIKGSFKVADDLIRLALILFMRIRYTKMTRSNHSHFHSLYLRWKKFRKIGFIDKVMVGLSRGWSHSTRHEWMRSPCGSKLQKLTYFRNFLISWMRVHCRLAVTKGQFYAGQFFCILLYISSLLT